MRVGKELLRRQIGQNTASSQGDDASRISRHQIHVVLDQYDTLDAGKFRGRDQGFHDGMFVSGGDSGRWLIEQNNLRVERESGSDIKQLFLTLGERGGN